MRSLLLECYKVDVPNLDTYLNWTPIFEWRMVWCGSKNGYQEDMYVEEFRPHAQNMITILDSTVHIIGGGGEDLYHHLMSTGIFTLIMNMIFL